MLLRTIGTNTHEKQNAPNIIINCALYNLTDLITCRRYDIILCAIVKQREEYEYSCNARRVSRSEVFVRRCRISKSQTHIVHLNNFMIIIATYLLIDNAFNNNNSDNLTVSA